MLAQTDMIQSYFKTFNSIKNPFRKMIMYFNRYQLSLKKFS